MRAYPGRSLALLAVIAALVAGVPAPVRADREAEHEELRRIARTIKDAVNARRLDELMPLLAKDFSITMVDQTVVTEPRHIPEYFRRYFEAPDAILQSVHIEPEADILTVFLDDVTGVNRGSSTDTYTLRNGRQVVFRTRWSGTFRKDGGQWKIVSLHIGTNFLDNPILAAVRAERFVWGAAGLGIGVVVAGAGGWWLGRRRRPRS